MLGKSVKVVGARIGYSGHFSWTTKGDVGRLLFHGTYGCQGCAQDQMGFCKLSTSAAHNPPEKKAVKMHVLFVLSSEHLLSDFFNCSGISVVLFLICSTVLSTKGFPVRCCSMPMPNARIELSAGISRDTAEFELEPKLTWLNGDSV